MNMWAAAPFPQASLSPQLKPLVYHSSNLWRALTSVPAGRPVSEAKQSHTDGIRGNICKAGAGDCADTSPVQANNSPTVGDKLKKERILEKKSGSIAHIRWMLSTFDDGRVSISPYDTAWLALIANGDGNGSPQFPSSLEWVAQNQLQDGSWGDEYQYSAYDRLLNTLACVIALKSWNVHPPKIERGIRFMNGALTKLEGINLDRLTCGFEIIFPPLLERARDLGIHIPYDGPFLLEILALREQKLQRIPRDYMHEVPTAMLYSLEGMGKLNWEKMIQLKTEEGDFLTSPSSTAFAYMQTGDKKCFEFLNNVVTKFDGGAPTVFPIDVFARLWAVDRLQRLGISHLFEKQIIECLNYVYRYWTQNGVFSGRNARVCDLDDTAMGFRLLRLQGYDVSADVFNYYKSDEGFYCFGGEMNGSPTTLLNLYKASQVRFPGENVLEEAGNFSFNFLKERVLLNNNEILDKWVVSKDFAGELKFGLQIPWFACLPRLESRFYIEQYGGANDVWIAKVFYRVEEISNNHYLEVAKSEFNECQVEQLEEWRNMFQWWEKFNLKGYGLSRKELLLTYFLAAASIFELRRSTQRYAWAKSWAIIKILGIYLCKVATSREKRCAFFTAFQGAAHGELNGAPNEVDEMGKCLLWIIQELIHQQSIDTFQGLQRDVRQRLTTMWETWLRESLDIENGRLLPHEAAFLAHTINLCSGNVRADSSCEELNHLSNLTNKVCFQLRQHRETKGTTNGKVEEIMGSINSMDIERSMQELLKMVLQIDTINQNVKQTFLMVAKAFYYAAYCDQQIINFHISKVLFQPLL